MGARFSFRNKDRGWCVLKRPNYPSSDQPKPGEGWVMPFQKFQAMIFPCGTLASFALCPCTNGKELKVQVTVGPFLLPVPLMLCDQDDSGFDVRCLMSSPGSTYCPSLWLQILLVKWGQDPFFRFPRRSKEIKCFVSHEVLPTPCFLHPFLFGWPRFFPSQAQVLLLYNHPHTHCKA